MKLGRYSVEQRIQQKLKNIAFTAIDQNEATDFNEGLFFCVFYIPALFLKSFYNMTLIILSIIIIKIIKNLTSSDVILFITKIYSLHDIQYSNDGETFKTLGNCKSTHVHHRKSA